MTTTTRRSTFLVPLLLFFFSGGDIPDQGPITIEGERGEVDTMDGETGVVKVGG